MAALRGLYGRWAGPQVPDRQPEQLEPLEGNQAQVESVAYGDNLAGDGGERPGRFSISGSIRELAAGAQSKVNGAIDAARAKKEAAEGSIRGAVARVMPNLEEGGIAATAQHRVAREVGRARLLLVPKGDLRLKLAELEAKGEIPPLRRHITDAEMAKVRELKIWMNEWFQHKDFPIKGMAVEHFEIEGLTQIAQSDNNDPDFAERIFLATFVRIFLLNMKATESDRLTRYMAIDTIVSESRCPDRLKVVVVASIQAAIMYRLEDLYPRGSEANFRLKKFIEIQKAINHCFKPTVGLSFNGKSGLEFVLEAAKVTAELCTTKEEKEIAYSIISANRAQIEQQQDDDGAPLEESYFPDVIRGMVGQKIKRFARWGEEVVASQRAAIRGRNPTDLEIHYIDLVKTWIALSCCPDYWFMQKLETENFKTECLEAVRLSKPDNIKTHQDLIMGNDFFGVHKIVISKLIENIHSTIGWDAFDKKVCLSSMIRAGFEPRWVIKIAIASIDLIRQYNLELMQKNPDRLTGFSEQRVHQVLVAIDEQELAGQYNLEVAEVIAELCTTVKEKEIINLVISAMRKEKNSRPVDDEKQ